MAVEDDAFVMGFITGIPIVLLSFYLGYLAMQLN